MHFTEMYKSHPISPTTNLSNERCMGNIYQYGSHIYYRFQYSPNVMTSIENDIYTPNDIAFKSSLRSKITRTPFIGINGKTIEVSDLIDRDIEGIPIIEFNLVTPTVGNPRIDIKIVAFLVDKVELKPLEKLRIKAEELYNEIDVKLFKETMNIVNLKYYDAEERYEVPKLPSVRFPYLEVPQSVNR